MTVIDVKLAQRNVFRQGFRSLLPLSVVLFACLIVILIGGIYQYLFDTLEEGVIRAEGQIWITPAEKGRPFVDRGLFQSLGGTDGVSILSPRATLSGIIGFGEKSSLFSGRAVDADAEAAMDPENNDVLISADREPKAKIGKLLAEGLGVAEGDWISGIAGDDGFSARIARIVTTESEENDRFFLEIPFSSLGGMNYDLIDSLHVTVKPGANPESVAARLKNAFAAGGHADAVFTRYTSPEGYVNAVRTIYGNNLAFILIVIAITVFFTISAAFTLSLTERTKELGTMRSFGASPSRLGLIFQIESCFLSLYGFGFGFALSLAIGSLVNLLGGIEMPPPPTVAEAIHVGFHFHPVYPALAFVLVFGIGQLSTFAVTRRLNRMNIIGQLGLD
ncbi:MAG: FtsX-like permease family protein [Spirochaetales bacterium]|nr:FtsX-like permease family protein [Spirochaetales bacterium]